MLTIDEVNAILKIKKETSKIMEWIIKPNKSKGRWYQYETACKIKNEIREDLYFRAQWRGEYPDFSGQSISWKSEYISCGLFAANNRIIAIDCSDAPHRNPPNTGLPFAGERISGFHIHKWTEYGDRHAEPLQLTNKELKTIIEEVCCRSNTLIKGGFKSPPTMEEQLPLFG